MLNLIKIYLKILFYILISVYYIELCLKNNILIFSAFIIPLIILKDYLSKKDFLDDANKTITTNICNNCGNYLDNNLININKKISIFDHIKIYILTTTTFGIFFIIIYIINFFTKNKCSNCGKIFNETNSNADKQYKIFVPLEYNKKFITMVNSQSDLNIKYKVNLNKLSCDCLDWKEKRFNYPLNDIRRCCKHIVYEYDKSELYNNLEIWQKILFNKKIGMKHNIFTFNINNNIIIFAFNDNSTKIDIYYQNNINCLYFEYNNEYNIWNDCNLLILNDLFEIINNNIDIINNNTIIHLFKRVKQQYLYIQHNNYKIQNTITNTKDEIKLNKIYEKKENIENKINNLVLKSHNTHKSLTLNQFHDLNKYSCEHIMYCIIIDEILSKLQL